jgi:hypothetical protein
VLRLLVALNKTYQVKDLRRPSKFLGMEIRHETSGIYLSQDIYINELLYRFAMDEARTTHTPMVPKSRLDNLTDESTKSEEGYMQGKPYRQMVGSLLYLARVSRPDIAFAVNQLRAPLFEVQEGSMNCSKVPAQGPR